MTGMIAWMAAVPPPLAGTSALSAALVAVVLHRRDRRRTQRPGIRRHDGSGRVWEYASAAPSTGVLPERHDRYGDRAADRYDDEYDDEYDGG